VTRSFAACRGLWALARPRLLPFVLVLPLVGFGWAHWDKGLPLRGEGALPWVLAAWVLLQTGTLWLNAALDRDQGEVLLGRPVAVPRGVVPCGYAALLAAVSCAFWGHHVSGWACVLCAALAVLYSHPATAWKGHPVLGPLVNGLGYGLLSPLAGWAVVDVAPDARTVLAWLCGGLGVLGCYFAAQAFQGEEDAARGYRTLVVTHGPAVTVLVGRGCIAAGFLGGVTLALVGWVPRACLLAVPLWVWIDRWLRRWAELPGGGERWARGVAVRMLVGVAGGVALALADYLYACWAGGPPAGLGTPGGH
jgi:4-hydroxybenzoate polyprenyltransferase